MTPIEHYIIRNTQIELEDVRSYFNCKKYKGKFFVQMKKEVVTYLKSKGVTHKIIAEAMGYNNHGVITHINNYHQDIDKDSVAYIKSNWENWIRVGLYPKTVNKMNGVYHLPVLKLVEKGEL